MEKEILARIELLRNVIAWSKEHGGLTTGQRICLHQEIAGQLERLEDPDIDNLLIVQWEISQALEEKVRHIQGVIMNTRWEKQECKY